MSTQRVGEKRNRYCNQQKYRAAAGVVGCCRVAVLSGTGVYAPVNSSTVEENGTFTFVTITLWTSSNGYVGVGCHIESDNFRTVMGKNSKSLNHSNLTGNTGFLIGCCVWSIFTSPIRPRTRFASVTSESFSFNITFYVTHWTDKGWVLQIVSNKGKGKKRYSYLVWGGIKWHSR